MIKKITVLCTGIAAIILSVMVQEWVALPLSIHALWPLILIVIGLSYMFSRRRGRERHDGPIDR